MKVCRLQEQGSQKLALTSQAELRRDQIQRALGTTTGKKKGRGLIRAGAA